MKQNQYIRTMYSGLLTGLLTCLCLVGFGQEVNVSSELDTNRILLGDQLLLTLTVSAPANMRVKFPLLTDTLTADIEVVESTLLDTVSLENNRKTLDQSWLITSFGEGKQQLPPLEVIAGGDTFLALTAAFEVVPVEVDTTKNFRPIKGPVNVGYTFWEIFRWFLLAFLIIGLAVGGYFGYRWWKAKQIATPPPLPVEPPEPVIPPHVIALREFEVLKAEQLWQSGKIKEYHSRVTDILRAYIEKRYEMLALEQTSAEILQSFRDKGLTSSVPFMELKQILSLADLVKFAKAQPLANENESSLENAIRFVKTTAQSAEEKEASTTPIPLPPEVKPAVASGWETIKDEPELVEEVEEEAEPAAEPEPEPASEESAPESKPASEDNQDTHTEQKETE